MYACIVYILKYYDVSGTQGVVGSIKTRLLVIINKLCVWWTGVHAVYTQQTNTPKKTHCCIYGSCCDGNDVEVFSVRLMHICLRLSWPLRERKGDALFSRYSITTSSEPPPPRYNIFLIQPYNHHELCIFEIQAKPGRVVVVNDMDI